MGIRNSFLENGCEKKLTEGGKEIAVVLDLIDEINQGKIKRD